MDETANALEAHIDRTRERLGSNLKELENKVDAATDWREYFRERPYLFLGAALAGGAVLATAIRRMPATRETGEAVVRRVASINGPAREQASDLWKNIQGALARATRSL